MRILYATPPGRLPTVNYDPGPWWDGVASDAAYDVVCHSLNFDWWTVLIGPGFARVLLEPLSPLERRHREAAWRANRIDVDALAAAAARSLEQLQSAVAYRSDDSYLDTLAPLARFIETINQLQSEFHLDVDVGPRVRRLDYSDSRTLISYSRSSGFSAGPSMPRSRIARLNTMPFFSASRVLRICCRRLSPHESSGHGNPTRTSRWSIMDMRIFP